ncbi:uncharacterized protein LOC118444990 [Vespa mandarinia]|uniref:uncharacterized protein LOC118444990 n=1 Tax=Vespa mandarinia TaxID=7446 RepID=UPI00160CB9A6|nr:uncharacterized protein LOC118444990 [Vespa mandarinia]
MSSEGRATSGQYMPRKKKKYKLNKYVVPLIVGFLLIKSILLPIALKALAVLSGKAVVLSLMSLILAAIVGLKKVAQSSSSNSYDVVNIPSSKYRRKDAYDVVDDFEEEEPYRFYREYRKKK